MDTSINNIPLEIPSGLAKREALFSALNFVIVNYLNNAELQSIFTSLGQEGVFENQLLNASKESWSSSVSELIKKYDEEDRLIFLINQIQFWHPTTWYDHIWLHVRPCFYLPNTKSFFISRFEHEYQIIQELSNTSANIVVLKGINGIGKTDLALAVANKLKERKEFDGIFWIDLQGRNLRYMDKVYEWGEWLHELAISFAWTFEDAPEKSRDNQQYWEKLKTSNFLLCIDGMDDLNGSDEIIDFLNNTNENDKCKVIITTILNINIKNKIEILLGGFKPDETKNWILEASLSRNITELKGINDQQIQQIHESLAGIPLALNWYASQLTSYSIENVDVLKDISSEDLLKKLFEASFNQLSEPSKTMLFALSIFNWSATSTSWYATAGLSEEEFELNLLQLTSFLTIYASDLNRYSLYSIVKDYCKDKINNLNKSDILYSQWIEYFISFSENNGRSLRRRYDLIDQEWGNLWQAIQYCIEKWKLESPDFQLSDQGKKYGRYIINFANLLQGYCQSRGREDEELELLHAAVEAADVLHSSEILGDLTYRVGWLLCNREKFYDARKSADLALDQLNSSGKRSGYAYRLYARIERMEATAKSELSIHHPSYAKIEEHLNNAKKTFINSGDQRGLARVFSDLGRLAYFCENYLAAYEYNLQALNHFKEIGDIDGEVNSLVNLGDTALELNEFQEADQYYNQATKIIGASDFVKVSAEIQRGKATSIKKQAASLASIQKRIQLKHAYTLADSAYKIFLRLRANDDIRTTKQILMDIETELNELNSEVANINNLQKEGKENNMLSPQEQLAVGVLIEGVKFLYSELGRRLDYWREKKGEAQSPKKVEVVKNTSGEFTLQLDDIQKVITLMNTEDIKSSIKILRSYKITLNTYKEELAKPNLEPTRKAGLLVDMPELEQKIEEEGSKLQSLIEQTIKR